ncbi:MAG: sugar O-acetyltransferase [Proteobacteria bacterium]|nr:sugar O-acetyltransferase [Pseudomonadota bacterium]
MITQKLTDETLYKGSDDDLLFKKHQASKLLYEINNSHPDNRMNIHENILPKLFSKLGKNTWFEFPFNCDYGEFIEIGNNCYFNHHLSIGDGALVKIGNNVIVGPYVGLYTAEHPLDCAKRKGGWQSAKPITIGNNVWIGANVTILGGVTIGENAVIGAGSVVTKSIPDNHLAYGNPCKIIRELKI